MHRHQLVRYSATIRILSLIVAVVSGFVFSGIVPAHAATLTVTSNADSGAGTLRDTIAAAASGDTINFNFSGTITLSSQLTISQNLTIDGTGLSIILDAQGNDRVFCVPGATTVTIKGLTISNGLPSSPCLDDATDGGGIFSDSGSATVTVTNSTFSGNSADSGGGIYVSSGTMLVSSSTFSDNIGGEGGGIENSSDGTLTVTNSILSGNSADDGGGITNYGTMTLTNSTLFGNSVTGAESEGGGIYDGGFALTITNSTLSGNSATGDGAYGGGIFNATDPLLTITNCTLSGNSASGISSKGGGIYSDSASVQNTIIAGNAATTGPDIYGPVSSKGYNLIGSTSAASGFSASDLQNVAANLGPLANNGGPTQTMALLSGSPAIDAIPVASCVVAADQRGTARPQSAGCDIGAFESVLSVASAAAPAVLPTTCLTLGYQPSSRVRLYVPGSETTSNNVPVVVCYALLTDPVQVGVTQNFSLAVDVLAFTSANTSVAPLTQPVQVCLLGSGSLLFRDATGSPRVTTAISAISNGGYTCGNIPNAGTVILIPGTAALAGNADGGAAVVSHPLSNCLITTLYGLNLHSTPNGSITGLGVPAGVTLSATARAGDWIQVTYGNTQGWLLIPNDLSLSLNCN